MKALFLTAALLITPAAQAHEMETVFTQDKVAIEVPADATWLAVAAGYTGFITATDTASEEMALWRAHRDCDTNLNQDCGEYIAIELPSDSVVAVAYCADGYYNSIAGIGVGENEERARAAAVQRAESIIAESGYVDDEMTEEESEVDPATVVKLCRSVLLHLIQ